MDVKATAIAVLAASACAVSISLIAEPDQRARTTAGGLPSAKLEMAAAAGRGGTSVGVGLRSPVTKATQPSEAECAKLGGAVLAEPSGICASGEYCSTTDQNGAQHRICIAKP